MFSYGDRLVTPNARLLVALYDAPRSTERALAAQLNCSLWTVSRYVRTLEAAGYISVDRSNMYSQGCIFTVRLTDAEIAALRLLVAREDAAGTPDTTQAV